MGDDRPPTDGTREHSGNATGGAGGARDGSRVDRHPPVTDGGVSISEILDALAHKRRRYVLYYLRDVGTAELDDVIEQVAAWETGQPPDELDEQTMCNVRIDLYHAHLPKLEAAGVIGYDRRHGSTCFRNPPEPVAQFLEFCATIEKPEPVDT